MIKAGNLKFAEKAVSLFRMLSAIRRDNFGSVAITFALAAIPIVAAVGSAVDYSLANRTKARLDSYADAAALSATNQAAMSLSTADAQTFAVNSFKANAITLKVSSVTAVAAKVTTSNNIRTAVVTYTANVPTYFMGIAGVNNITINGTSTAQSGAPAYVDFYMLLDNTPSMGVGATPADVTKMVNNTSANVRSPAISSMSRPTITTASPRNLA